MIIFGWGKDARHMGDGYVHTCQHCGNTNRFAVLEVKKKITLYFVPVIKWSHSYAYVCPVCSYGQELANQEQAQRLLAAAFRDACQTTCEGASAQEE